MLGGIETNFLALTARVSAEERQAWMRRRVVGPNLLAGASGSRRRRSSVRSCASLRMMLYAAEMSSAVPHRLQACRGMIRRRTRRLRWRSGSCMPL